AAELLMVPAAAEAMLIRDLKIVLDQVDILIESELVRREQRVQELNLRLVGGIRRQSCRNRHAEKYRVRQVTPLSIVIEEEEIFVLDYRTAERASELVHVERLPRDVPRIVDPGVGVHVAVAQIVERGAVKIVGAGLGDHVGDRSAGAS